MSCGCKSNGSNATNNGTESEQMSGSIMGNMRNMGPMNPNNPFIVRIIYFAIAAPLVILLLPAVYIILFNHIVIGKSLNIVNLLKKILLIDFINGLKSKLDERRKRKEEKEYQDSLEGDYEYEDVYITPIEKVEVNEENINPTEKIDSKETE